MFSNCQNLQVELEGLTERFRWSSWSLAGQKMIVLNQHCESRRVRRGSRIQTESSGNTGFHREKL